MNPQAYHPTGGGSNGDGRRIDLRAAYLLFIRAYVRRRHLSAPPKSGEATDA